MTVNALPFLLNRIKPRRPRMHTSLLGFTPNNPDVGCSTPAKFSVAELVQPWLEKWNLTPSPASQPSHAEDP